jgi:hypothetical protein
MKAALVLEIAIVVLGIASPARAETTARLRIPVSSVPRQDEPIKIDPKNAVLPDGAREGSPLPKGWKMSVADLDDHEFGHCTDDRRASVATSGNDETSTDKIWETNGKVFLDRARVKIVDGKVHVISAERVPVVYVAESIWAFRNASTVRLVIAVDSGFFARRVSWGCFVQEHAVAVPAGAMAIDSSPDRVDEVLKENSDKKQAPWKGVAVKLLVSVSKASADPEPMLNLVIKRP